MADVGVVGDNDNCAPGRERFRDGELGGLDGGEDVKVTRRVGNG